MIYTLSLTINNITPLVADDYKLCIAIGVDGKFNVVWSGDMKYKPFNIFRFTDRYRVTSIESFEHGQKASLISESDHIQPDQVVSYTSNGIFKTTRKMHGFGGLIYVNNNFGGEVHFGLQVQRPDGSYSDIFVEENTAASELSAYKTPTFNGDTPEVLVWFDQELETGTMFSHPLKNSFRAKFYQGLNYFEVSYTVCRDDPAGGLWLSESRRPKKQIQDG